MDSKSANIKEKVKILFSKMYLDQEHNNPITLLHISDDYTVIANGNSDEPENIWILSIGTHKTSKEYFYHNPPTASEVENAIMVVEDEVMPLRKSILPSQLITTDLIIKNIAEQSSCSIRENFGTILSIKDMEDVFSRLAAIISGRPASLDTLPTDNIFATALLILREVMHHIGFESILISSDN